MVKKLWGGRGDGASETKKTCRKRKPRPEVIIIMYRIWSDRRREKNVLKRKKITGRIGRRAGGPGERSAESSHACRDKGGECDVGCTRWFFVARKTFDSRVSAYETSRVRAEKQTFGFFVGKACNPVRDPPCGRARVVIGAPVDRPHPEFYRWLTVWHSWGLWRVVLGNSTDLKLCSSSMSGLERFIKTVTCYEKKKITFY